MPKRLRRRTHWAESGLTITRGGRYSLNYRQRLRLEIRHSPAVSHVRAVSRAALHAKCNGEPRDVPHPRTSARCLNMKTPSPGRRGERLSVSLFCSPANMPCKSTGGSMASSEATLADEQKSDDRSRRKNIFFILISLEREILILRSSSPSCALPKSLSLIMIRKRLKYVPVIINDRFQTTCSIIPEMACDIVNICLRCDAGSRIIRISGHLCCPRLHSDLVNKAACRADVQGLIWTRDCHRLRDRPPCTGANALPVRKIIISWRRWQGQGINTRPNFGTGFCIGVLNAIFFK